MLRKKLKGKLKQPVVRVKKREKTLPNMDHDGVEEFQSRAEIQRRVVADPSNRPAKQLIRPTLVTVPATVDRQIELVFKCARVVGDGSNLSAQK